VFQRPHQRSDHAAPKPYGFVAAALSSDFDPVVITNELRERRPEWIDSQWKWHVESRFCILRAGERAGYPGSELTRGHSIDQPNLAWLPRLRAFLDSAFPVAPKLAWLGWLPRGARIFLHVDNTRHWDEHHRVHVPLLTNPDARLCVGGGFLHLRPRHAWIMNNSVPHGAINRGADRLHLVLDLPHSPLVEAWIARGYHEAGEPDPDALAELSQDPLNTAAARAGFDSARLARMLLQ
jgi:kumamolisin